MALVAKITKVEYLQNDGEGNTIDLSLSGRFMLEAVYYDSATPATILLTQKFEFPQETTEQQAQDAIIAVGRKVRDARTRTNALKQFIGAVIPL